MQPLRITLAGSLGSGKSSVGRQLSKRLGAEFISTGEIFRSIGKVSNLNALQTNLEAESNTSIDEKVDGFILEKAASDDHFIMDSRMAWHFVPKSLKVYLYASYEVAAQRIQSDKTRETESYENIEEAKDALRKRRSSEQSRYKKLYDVEIDDFENYDLVIVSDSAAVDDIVDVILKSLEKPDSGKFFMSKRRVVPMMSIRELSGVSHIVRPKEMGCLDAILESGFGFVFESPYKLAQFLMLGDEMICINDRMPSYVGTRDRLFEDAKQMGIGHFYDWEEINGQDFDIKSFVSQVSSS
ncbi:MAG: cytidylate kinase family protein [Bacteroidota bacterium]